MILNILFIISLLIAYPNSEAIQNAYMDYSNTIIGLQRQEIVEMNPIAREIFNHTGYNERQALGGGYLIGIALLAKLPTPFNSISYLVDIGHFWGYIASYKIIDYPVKLTFIRYRF